MADKTEYKVIEIKSFDDVEGIFTGFGAYYNNVDKVNDIILPNAFDKSIQEFKSNARKIQFNYEHKSDVVLNDNFDNIENQPDGLLSIAKVSSEAKQKYSREFKNMVELSKQGKGAMSVEFVVKKSIKQGDIRIIQEAELFGIAWTKNPANSEAKVKEVKSLQIPKYPISLEDSWDSAQAEQRWRDYSNSTDKPSVTYKKGFLYYDNTSPDNFTSYHLQVVDIVDDEPVINDRAVFAVNGVLNGSRGVTLKVVPESEIPRLKSIVNELYKRINTKRKQEGKVELDLPSPESKSLDANFDIKNAIKRLNNIDFAKTIFRKYKKNMSRNEGDDLIDRIYQLGMVKANPNIGMMEEKGNIPQPKQDLIIDVVKIKEHLSKI